MTHIIAVLPEYEPKINENNTEKIDLNIRDLQNKYSNGCICCGTTFYPKKYSSMIASHFNTAKHKKKCLYPANQLFIEDFGSSNNLKEAFDKKCKELREEKKLAYNYKDELDKMKLKSEKFEVLNFKLQEKISEILKSKIVKCENLIDL
tara:strand:+ start:12508 stop:12954 length:447 start_codon:yes stop_codon:yes gene_type:complete